MLLETKELYEKKAEAVQSAETLYQTAKNENRDLNESEQKQFDAYMDEVESCNQEIKRIEKLNDAKKDKEEQASRMQVSTDEQEDLEDRFKKVFQKSMRYGADKLTEEEQKTYQEFAETRQMTTTDGDGGELVPTDLAEELFRAMKQFGSVRQAARIITTTSGNQIDYPTSDDTGNKGELVSENTSISDQKITTGSKKLEAFKYSSKFIKVPFELLQDSQFDVESFVRENATERIGRITEEHYTTGDGSSKPNGIVTASVEGARSSNTNSFTFDDILELKHSIDPAHRQSNSFGFMLHDDTLKQIKQLSIGSSDARPLWQPSFVQGEPDTIDGEQYWINQEMSKVGTSNKIILAGDFSKYIIRDVGDVRMRRLVERFADKDQVGFVMLMRTDAELMNAGNDPVKYLQNATS